MRGRDPGSYARFPGNYRVGLEPPWKERASPYTEAITPPVPRTLRTSESMVPVAYAPGAVRAIPEADKVPFEVWEGTGLPRDLIPLVRVLEKLVNELHHTREQPFEQWRVDTIALVNTGPTWLDQFAPIVAGQQRYLEGRRALIVINQDNANAVWVRHTNQAVNAGGFIAASGSIMIPLSHKARIHGISVAATSSISFYQFA